MALQSINPADLRRWEREPAAIAVNLVLKADKLRSDTFAGTIDVSLCGVCVRTTLTLLPRQGVAIILEGQFSRTLPARVVWVRKEASSNSTIAGLKFLL